MKSSDWEYAENCGKRKQVSRLVSHYLPEKIITNQFDSFHMWPFVQKDRYRPLNTMMFGCYNSISHPHPFKKCLWPFWVFGQIWVSQLYFIFSFKGKAHALCSICTVIHNSLLSLYTKVILNKIPVISIAYILLQLMFYL